MDFSAEVAAHKVIHEKLDTLIAYIKEFKEDVSKFDATRLKEMMAAFKDPLVGLPFSRLLPPDTYIIFIPAVQSSRPRSRTHCSIEPEGSWIY